jgi:hypothetical protein
MCPSFLTIDATTPPHNNTNPAPTHRFRHGNRLNNNNHSIPSSSDPNTAPIPAAVAT